MPCHAHWSNPGSTGANGYVDLKDGRKEWQRLGEPVDLLCRSEVSGLIGTDHFYGGLLNLSSGTINPMGYCRGLARAGTMFGETMAGLLTGMDRADLLLPTTEICTAASASIMSRRY